MIRIKVVFVLETILIPQPCVVRITKKYVEGFFEDDVSQDTHHNPYNQVETSVSYNECLHDLSDHCQISSQTHVPDWYKTEISYIMIYQVSVGN